ncbi:HAMP domain-containing protein [Massilia sp. H-1]|nr:HAMP domain-containing protein [Massilia sp. H-1]
MLDRADQGNGASAVAIVDQKPVQIVVMPVKAPVTIAWVVMGFVIDRQMAVDMRELSALDVVILTRARRRLDHGRVDAAPKFMPALAADLRPLAADPRAPFDLAIGEARHSARLLAIGQDDAHSASVLLVRSIDAATEQYTRLERTLVALTILGIVVAACAAVFTAKRIAQPLRELAWHRASLERGDYRGQIDVKRDDEVGALAKAFDSMRDGIARREKEIRRLAYWDQLTNLPNRAQFVLMLDEALGRRASANTPCMC